MLEKSDLTMNELIILNTEQKKEEKSLGLAYLMLLGGHLGLHRFYVGKKISGSIQLVLFLLTMLFYILGSAITALIFGMFPFAIPLFIWIVIDFFHMKKMITRYNAQVEHEILHQLWQIRHDQYRRQLAE